jgi:hypothetical protein
MKYVGLAFAGLAVVYGTLFGLVLAVGVVALRALG